MITLTKTKHSNFVAEILNSGKGINVAANSFFLLRQFIGQCHDPEIAVAVQAQWKAFAGFLKDRKLRLTLFAFGYNDNGYHYIYEIQSRVHDNPALRVQGQIQDLKIPFVFFPAMFAVWLEEILNEAPLSLLEEVAKGN